MSTRINDYIISISQLISGYRTAGEISIGQDRLQEISPFIDSGISLRILDLANGQLRPQYILLKSQGHLVYGIDLINTPEKFLIEFGYTFARWIFKLHIRNDKFSTRKDKLVTGDVIYLPFRNNYFEIVTSVAAFEHFLDVPNTVREIHRVLKPGGIAYIRIHLFTCPSGGHNIKLMEVPLQTIPKGVDAWDHLRKRNLSFHVPLNELRKHQYLEEFLRYFEIVNHYCASPREGEHLLTPEIEAELSDYSRDELTCGAYVIVARKNQ